LYHLTSPAAVYFENDSWCYKNIRPFTAPLKRN
jgi:hypothetical protein